MGTTALEKHYRVRELADLWALSDNTIIRMFANESGVIHLESPNGKRRYVTLSIPESVALRVHDRLGQELLQSKLPARNPLRVVRLGNLHARVPKQSRNVLKLKTG